MTDFLLIVLALAPIFFACSKPKPAPKPAVVARPNVNPQRPIIMMPAKQRDFVPPDTVGVPKDCPFPTVRKPIKFLCPKCGLRGQTHVLYPHLPWCPKDGTVMNEVE